MQQDDGGPAFPVLENIEQFDDFKGEYVDRYAPNGGMSLRDYFAAKAMQTIFAGDGAQMVANRDDRYSEGKGNWAEVVAANSYEMAAAMIEARKKVTS